MVIPTLLDHPQWEIVMLLVLSVGLTVAESHRITFLKAAFQIGAAGLKAPGAVGTQTAGLYHGKPRTR